jgi:predicted outer membrane repeat protein
MEQKCLAGTQKSGLRSRTLYRVAAVGIATLITQASPGGAASSWGVECLTTDLANNSYCVTSLNDDIPSDSEAWTLRTNEATWTLRKSVDEANTRAAVSATIGFQDALFGIQRSGAGAVVNNSQTESTANTNPTIEKKIVLDSTLEIKTNITITAPTDADGRILLTIERGTGITTGDPLIGVNDKLTPTVSDERGMDSNKATTEVKIENVTIDSRSNPGTTSTASSNVFSTPGVAIQVKETIENTAQGESAVTPTVVLSNTIIKNTVSETGGAAITTPDDVTLSNSSVLTDNVAANSAVDAPAQDGGAIKAGGNVTVTSNSSLTNNTATGSGGAIKAGGDVTVSSNSSLTNNTATGSGGAVQAGGNVSVSESTLTGNTATTGNGGAISAGDQVTVSASTLNGNTATLGSGGAVSAAAQVTVSASTVSSNIAKQSGGAISAGDQVTVSASTLNSNTAELGTGGAISTTAYAAVSISGSELKTNSALINGGAIAARGAVEVSASTLNSNTAELGNGGAISTVGAVTVAASTLNSNTAEGSGGAISTITTVAVSESSTVSSNTAKDNGGAISALGAVTVSASTLNSNTATEGDGGGISAREVTVSASTLNSNTATLGSGGAIWTVVSVTVIETSTVSSNTANENGGAIKAGGDVLVAQSTLSNNTATTGSGGAISTAADVAVLNSSTLSSNVTNSNGGAISAGGQVEVSASTLNGNTATEGDGGTISAGSDVTVSGSALNYNTAEGSGGAISAEGTVAIANSEFIENEANYRGGAVASESQVTISRATGQGEPSNFALNSADYGGAIYAGDSVKISDAKFEENSAYELGGAILIDSESQDKSTISDSTFEGNYGGLAGGAIFGNEAKLVISNTDFLYNSADVVGGAIAHGGDLEVIDSTFTGNTASANAEGIQVVRDECKEVDGLANADCTLTVYFDEFDPFENIDMGMGSFYGFAGGGAIRVFTPSEVLSLTNQSEEEQNQQNVLPQQTVSILNSDFLENSAQGDGGAIYFLGLLQILGSRFEENWALPALFSYDSELDSLGVRGSGGAIYGEKIEISGSEFDANFATVNGGAIFTESSLEILDTEFEENVAMGDIFSDAYEYEGDGGGGGAIAVAGSVSVTDSLFVNNATFANGGAINLLDGDLTVKDSIFDGNEAFGKGGAIYSLGDLNVSGSTFGSAEPDNNPDYNPVIGREENDLWDPNYLIPNPDYNPVEMVPNPNFNNQSTVQNVLSIVPPTIPNPSCTEDFTVIYDGQCFHYADDNYWFQLNQERPRFPLIIDNSSNIVPEFIDNPQYDPRESIENELYDPIESMVNEFYDPNEFIFLRLYPGSPGDDYKYNYGGNSSGDDGGAIYVVGATTIRDSSFTGNTSENDGGAIYSEGTLQIKDSSFKRNWAEDDGGAIRTEPGEGDLFITRTSFTENVSMDDGGAISISTMAVEHYDDVVLSSVFRDNEAFGTGGAIDSSYAVLILNTFEDNKSLEGQSLNLSGGYLSGNVLIGPVGGQNLCYVASFTSTFANYGTDESCFFGSNNFLLTREQIAAEGALHTLPEGYEATLLGELKGNEEFFLEAPTNENPKGELAPLGTFITDELNKDFKSEIRDPEVLWTAGHLQGIFPNPPIAPEGDNSVGDTEIVEPKDKEEKSQEQNSGRNNQVVVNQPDSTNLDSPVLIFEPTLSAEELARISQLRAEQLAAELLRQKEAERIAAENLAKKKAAKLARDKARALAAEKRRAQLAALKAKIAATQARGEALKQKSSWINLMKNSPNSNTVKRLVRVPAK